MFNFVIQPSGAYFQTFWCSRPLVSVATDHRNTLGSKTVKHIGHMPPIQPVIAVLTVWKSCEHFCIKFLKLKKLFVLFWSMTIMAYTWIFVPLLLGVRFDQHLKELLSHSRDRHLFTIDRLFWKVWNWNPEHYFSLCIYFFWADCTHLQGRVFSCLASRPSAPCWWCSRGRACSPWPRGTFKDIHQPLLGAPGSGAWGRTWRCHRRPWPWQSRGARREPSRCTAAHNPSPGRALCGICGNHIWTERNVKKLQNCHKNLWIFAHWWILRESQLLKLSIGLMFLFYIMMFLQRCSYKDVLTVMFLQWCSYKDVLMKMFLQRCSYAVLINIVVAVSSNMRPLVDHQALKTFQIRETRHNWQGWSASMHNCLHKPEDSKSINENFPLFKITFSPRTLLALSAITAPDKPAPTVEIIAKL